MLVLIDTCIWIEYFNRIPKIQVDFVDALILERQVATINPIKTEIMSGNMNTENKKIINNAFDAMEWIDADWNNKETWNKITNLSFIAKKYKIPIPGIVDRMILIAAQLSNVKIWTLDKSLLTMSKYLDLNYSDVH